MGASAQHSHYDTLQVAPQAAPEAVRSAYRRQAQKWHPDKLPGDVRAQKRMAQINEAYAVLSHPGRRASYDQWMRARRARIAADRAVAHAQPSRFAASWPWGLLFATIAFALLSVGTVFFKMAVPQVSAPLTQSLVRHDKAPAPDRQRGPRPNQSAAQPGALPRP